MRGAASPAHLMSQAPPVQLSEHEPVQVRWHVDALQLTLLDAPTVYVQLAPPVQLRLLEAPAESEQVLPPLQPPLHELPQVPSVQLPLGQAMVQLLPEELQLVCSHPADPPQAHNAAAIANAIHRMSASGIRAAKQETGGQRRSATPAGSGYANAGSGGRTTSRASRASATAQSSAQATWPAALNR